MKNREIEIENALNQASKEAGNNAYFGNGFKSGVKWMQEQDNWISVEDRLPLCVETGKWDGARSDFVLAIDKNEMHIVARCYNGFLDGNYFTEWANQDDYTVEFITHWQPLPEPPKH